MIIIANKHYGWIRSFSELCNMVIEKSTGVTSTEQLLADLCENTFLKLWSYPNPYKSEGKELCDVIAVFENHVFLFFDRESRKFDNLNDDVQVQWDRWYKKVIERQLKSSEGAKRHVLERPDQVFLDAKASIPLPIPLPTSDPIIHKIIVAHGAAEACKNDSSNNVTGSLAIWYSQPGMPRISTPFLVNLDSTEPVHVFDSSNLEVILRELDTVADFTSYLIAKEEAIKKYKVVTYCGEEDLLASYFTNVDELGEHFIGIDNKHINAITIEEGQWQKFLQSPQYLRKKDANKISEFWDNMLQHCSQNALDDKLIGDANVFTGSSPLLEMAKEPRTSRRMLSAAFRQAISEFPEEHNSIIRKLTLVGSYYKNKMFVLLQLYIPDTKDFDNEYRPKRYDLLKVACSVVKNQYPHLEKVIGIGIEPPKFSLVQANDYMLLECKEWSEETRCSVDRINQSFEFLQTNEVKKAVVDGREFPYSDKYFKPTKAGRNNPCPCGSGMKYKKCCLS